jgi:fumarate hydratase, class II
VIRCLGRIKAAAARVNAELGLLDHDLAERIAADDDAVAEGEHDDRSTSSRPAPGTSSNTNAKEVIAGWG